MIGKADHRAAILWSIMQTEDFHTDLSVFAVHLIEITNLTHCDRTSVYGFSFLFRNINDRLCSDRIFFLEIIKYFLFLSCQFRMCFKERNNNIKGMLRPFFIFRLIERVLSIVQDTLIIVTDMVNQTAAARIFAITNIKAALIIIFFTVNDRTNCKIRFLIPPCIKFRDISLCVLFFVKIFKYSISESKTAIRVCHCKIVNNITFADPIVLIISAETKHKAVRLLLRLFSFKSHIILILSDTSKCLFCLFLVSENIIQSFFDTVKLRNIIALFPTVHCMLIESGNKLFDSFIRNIRDLICHIVTNPPKGNVIKFFKGAVKESLSDLRISDLTLHTVKGAFYTVFAEISVKRVTEIFGIIIGSVRL